MTDPRATNGPLVARACRAGRVLVATALLVPLYGVQHVNADGAGGPPARPPRRACELAALQAMVPVDIDATLTFAVRLEDPARCRVDGVIVPGEPVSEVPIRFQVSMPDSFNGRYLLEAQGGSGGGAVPEPTTARLSAGFAIATTDKGTAPANGLDFSWMDDIGQQANYGYRANHLTAIVSQALARGYYRTRSLDRYIVGCSAGGNAGWAAMRVTATDDFDGVVIGASPAVPNAQVLKFARIAQHITRNPDGWIPPALMNAAATAIIAAYDDVDTVTDGIIQDDRLVELDDTVLRDIGFSDAQIETFDLIRTEFPYGGSSVPVTVGGYSISRVGTWSVWLTGQVPPPWSIAQGFAAPLGFLVAESSYRARLGPDFDFVTDLDVDDPADQALNASPFDGSMGDPFDLSAFRDSGGKVIMYFGMDDPAISPHDGMIAHDELATREQRPRLLDRWAQVYMVPGMEHCGGGPGPDDVQDPMLAAVVRWVERNRAPSSVVATTSDGTRTFLLCPEDELATSRGWRDVNDASNWRCRARPGS